MCRSPEQLQLKTSDHDDLFFENLLCGNPTWEG